MGPAACSYPVPLPGGEEAGAPSLGTRGQGKGPPPECLSLHRPISRVAENQAEELPWDITSLVDRPGVEHDRHWREVVVNLLGRGSEPATLLLFMERVM